MLVPYQKLYSLLIAALVKPLLHLLHYFFSFHHLVSPMLVSSEGVVSHDTYDMSTPRIIFFAFPLAFPWSTLYPLSSWSLYRLTRTRPRIPTRPDPEEPGPESRLVVVVPDVLDRRVPACATVPACVAPSPGHASEPMHRTRFMDRASMGKSVERFSVHHGTRYPDN